VESFLITVHYCYP